MSDEQDDRIQSLVGIAPRRLAILEEKAAMFDALAPHLDNSYLIPRDMFTLHYLNRMLAMKWLAECSQEQKP